MKAAELYCAKITPRFIARMEDGTLRWVKGDFSGVEENGPSEAWFQLNYKISKEMLANSEIPYLVTPIFQPTGASLCLGTLNAALPD